MSLIRIIRVSVLIRNTADTYMYRYGQQSAKDVNTDADRDSTVERQSWPGRGHR